MTIPGSDNKYYKLNAEAQGFYPLDREHGWVLSSRISASLLMDLVVSVCRSINIIAQAVSGVYVALPMVRLDQMQFIVHVNVLTAIV